jgi:hypothetical protein
VADLPAILTVHCHDGTRRAVPLKAVEPYRFHASLVDRLANGTPMEVSALQSRNVVSVMEAAEQSARNGATPVVPHLHTS